MRAERARLISDHVGSLDAIDRVVQVVGLVRSAPRFVQQPRVLNGASTLFFAVLGERGRHSRMALATADLPMGASVEIAAIVRLGAAA